MKKYLALDSEEFMHGLKSEVLLKICDSHSITDILLINLSEIIFEAESKQIAQHAQTLGMPLTVLQQSCSHQNPDYDIIGTEWCAHTGLVWESSFSSRYIPDYVPCHHSQDYLYQTDVKLLCLLGKVRFPNRILFWDSLIESGDLSDLEYSYYPLIPDTDIYRQQSQEINYIQKFLRTPPASWSELARSADFDLNHKVPGSTPDAGNLFYSGYPTHPDLYQKTAGSIVPETTCQTHTHLPFITEKTYRTIQNHHPFCVFGDPGTNQHLRNQGYETFESEFGSESDPGDIMSEVFDSELSLIHRHSARQRLGDYFTTVRQHFAECYTDNYITLRDKCEHNRFQWLHNVVSEQQHLLSAFSDSEIYDPHKNQKVSNICHYLYQNHNVYLSGPD